MALPQIKVLRTADGAKDGLIGKRISSNMLPDIKFKA